MNSQSDLIIGRNAVKAALSASKEIDKLLISNGEKSRTLMQIINLAKDQGVVVKEVAKNKLDFISGGANHQGVIALVPAHSYSTVDDIFILAEKRNQPPFIIISDNIEDPHNLGAIIRTAECVGAHGLIIPKRRNASLSFSVSKSSAGALEFLPVAKVTNIARTIDELKQRGVWIFGADMKGTPYRESKLTGPIALVLGNEGSGISRLVKDKCDGIISLPMMGKISSLNVSVSAGVLMYEILEQRIVAGGSDKDA